MNFALNSALILRHFCGRDKLGKDSEMWKLYTAGQLGLRWILGETQKHSVELFAKFPFTETTIVYKTPQDEKVGETKLKQQYNAGFRYVYAF